jgi:hypothetical protein
LPSLRVSDLFGNLNLAIISLGNVVEGSNDGPVELRDGPFISFALNARATTPAPEFGFFCGT